MWSSLVPEIEWVIACAHHHHRHLEDSNPCGLPMQLPLPTQEHKSKTGSNTSQDELNTCRGSFLNFSLFMQWYVSLLIITHYTNHAQQRCENASKLWSIAQWREWIPMPIMVIKMESPAKKKLFVAPSTTSRATNETAIDTLISGKRWRY